MLHVENIIVEDKNVLHYGVNRLQQKNTASNQRMNI